MVIFGYNNLVILICLYSFPILVMNLKSNVPTCYINYIFHLRITLLFLFLFYSLINLIFMTLFLAWGIKHRNKEAVSILFSQIWEMYNIFCLFIQHINATIIEGTQVIVYLVLLNFV